MKNYKYLIIWLLILSLNFSFGPSNTDGRFRTIQLSGHSGGHLYGGEGLDEETVSKYGAFELRYAWQNSNPESFTTLRYF